ncbi:FAD-dependent oxidoreductase [Psychrobacter sp. JCM 18901]|uniref:FAD-dependent oxidoreductase n=1 Tax=Psychrobacter sp. JCM 18901 TaxID=1298609 RepID=UPI0021C4AC55|nr:FAD-dependent oxidoreductase [Psychrobacter sp. JCM 18901]
MSLVSQEPTHTSFPKRRTTAGIVIIGAGMAGSRFAIELARTQSNDDTARLPITLISKEPQVGYNRIMLSPVLSGESVFEETYLYELAEYEQLGITVLAGTSVDAIDTKQQCIELSDGQVLDYTELVLATGSQARVIPFANHDAKGVHVFRDIADVQVLTEYARQAKKRSRHWWRGARSRGRLRFGISRGRYDSGSCR